VNQRRYNAHIRLIAEIDACPNTAETRFWSAVAFAMWAYYNHAELEAEVEWEAIHGVSSSNPDIPIDRKRAREILKGDLFNGWIDERVRKWDGRWESQEDFAQAVLARKKQTAKRKKKEERSASVDAQ